MHLGGLQDYSGARSCFIKCCPCASSARALAKTPAKTPAMPDDTVAPHRKSFRQSDENNPSTMWVLARARCGF